MKPPTFAPMQVSFSATDIIEMVRPATTRGSTSRRIAAIAGLNEATPGDLTFLGNVKYRQAVEGTLASVVLLPIHYAGEPRTDQLFLLVDNPSIALAQVCARIEQTLWPRPVPGVHPTASVAPGAEVAASATVGPHCAVEAGARVGEHVHLQAHVFVGRNAVIGDRSWLMPSVVVSAECRVGRRVRLQSGVVVGSDGFGYEFVEGRHERVPQVGIVVIGDDVDIGANTTIDRARFSRTTIGEGTKIDNLVQIAHNVVIGRHCLICAQVGISGSATVEDNVVLGGQVGVAGHLTIGGGTKVGAQSGINGDVAPGSFLNGTPAISYQLERRLVVLQRRLPELFKRVDALAARLGGADKAFS